MEQYKNIYRGDWILQLLNVVLIIRLNRKLILKKPADVAVKSSFEKPIPFRSVHLTASQLQLTFSKETGLLTKMTNRKTGVSSFGRLLSQCVRY